MASKLLQSILNIEEPLSSRPGFKGRSTIQEIDPTINHDEEEYTLDETDYYLYDEAYKMCQTMLDKSIQTECSRVEFVVNECIAQLLPLNIMNLYIEETLPDCDVKNWKNYFINGGYHDFQNDMCNYYVNIIRDCIKDHNIYLSLSFSSRANHHTEEMFKFLDIFVGSIDGLEEPFLIGSFLFDQHDDLESFIIKSLEKTIKFFWSNIDVPPILLILLAKDMTLSQDHLVQVHPSFKSTLIVPCLAEICSQMLLEIKPKFNLLKQFTKYLESFLCKDSAFFELFCFYFADFFNINHDNYFELVNFYGFNYWNIRKYILTFCMPSEHMYVQITTVFTPEHLCTLIGASSVWQSLVNISLLLNNFWSFEHPNYSSLMIALELENIIRHGDDVDLKQLTNFNVDCLILLTELFGDQMPLVAPEVEIQFPIYYKMFQNFSSRAEEIKPDENQHNQTAIVYTTKELLKDYNLDIRKDPIRMNDHTQPISFSPYEGLGKFELEDCFDYSIESIDDFQVELIRLHNKKTDFLDIQLNNSVDSQYCNRKRHNSLTMF